MCVCVCKREREKEREKIENKLAFRNISLLQGHQTGTFYLQSTVGIVIVS